MSDMNDKELFALDGEGFIPGPGESEKDFLDRVRRAKENFAKNKKNSTEKKLK